MAGKPSKIIQMAFNPKWEMMLYLDQDGEVWTVRSMPQHNEWERVLDRVHPAYDLGDPIDPLEDEENI